MRQLCRSTPGVRRGCGYRQEGGIYLECGLSPAGVPLEHFIFDEPQILEVNIKAGVQLWEHPVTHVTHVIDWVGTKYYPYACDVIEEGRRFGFSRKVPKTIKWEELEPASRLILVHERGWVENIGPFSFPLDVEKEAHRSTCAQYRREALKLQRDLFRQDEHIKAPGKFHCNAYQYVTAKFNRAKLITIDPNLPDVWLDHLLHDYTPVLLEQELERMSTEGAFIKPWQEIFKAIEYYREHGSTTYRVYTNWALERPGNGWAYPEFKPAAIAAIPITNISCIRAADGEKHTANYRHIRARLSPLLNVGIADA